MVIWSVFPSERTPLGLTSYAEHRQTAIPPRQALMKLAVVTSIPTPYRDPFWNEVAAHSEVESLDVYYCAAGKPDRPWEVNWERTFNAHTLPSYNLIKWAGADASAYWVRGLQRELKRGSHDAVIIGGYNHPSMLQTIRGCVKRRQPFYMMCETYRRQKTWKSFAKDRLMAYICKHAMGGMPTGQLATAYLKSYGMSEDQMILVPNVPDVRQLWRLSEELGDQSAAIRGEHKLTVEGSILTFIGRLIPKKRPELVIRAFARFAPADAGMILVGDGPLMENCRSLVNELGLSNRVVMPGFCQPEEVPRYLAASRAFVLPSSETWGVAALEAVAMGVPAIISDEVGCHPDVVSSGECGTVVKARDLESLGQAMGLWLSGRPADSSVVAATTEKFTYDSVARRLVQGVGAAL